MRKKLLLFFLCASGAFLATCTQSSDSDPQIKKETVIKDVSPEEQYNQGLKLEKGDSEAIHQAISLYQAAAEKNYAPAKHQLGFLYYQGLGVPQDYAQALQWFKKGADQNYSKSQYGLGLLYEYSRGVSQNRAEAVHWYRLAADQKFIPAYEKLGWFYLRGEGVPQNYSEAIKWYQMGADAGDAACQYNLGTLYEKGRGVPIDMGQAAKLYRLAADQGNKNGQFNLGVLYSLGLGVPKDEALAVKYYGLSANQGDADAQFYLGQRYEEGRGVAKDLVRAHFWFNLAAAGNRETASKRRDELATRLTPEEISKAQQLASQWKPGKDQVEIRDNNNPKAETLGQAVGEFRQMALKDYKQAIDKWANQLVHKKFSEFNPLIWPDTDPKMGWSYFMNVSVIALGGAKTPHPLVAFYNPWADVFFLTVWEMQNGHAVMVDADVLMGDWVRLEKFPSDPVPLWLRSPDFKPVALGKEVAQSVQAFENRFKDADGAVWNLFLNFSDNEEIADDFNYSGVSLLLANSLMRLDHYWLPQVGEAPQLPLIRTQMRQALTLANSGKMKELLESASETLPVMKDLLLQAPLSFISSLKPVSFLASEGEAMLFMASITNANSCVSFLIKKKNNDWRITRIDAVSYPGFYKQL